MTKVITYGTFDLFHEGHDNLLRRAKELGDYLIVGVTAERYDRERGKLNVHNSLMQRIEDVKKSGFADEIIVEEYEGQKIEDIVKYEVDIFAIGSDWLGQFNYLEEYCKVVYLERTKGISSTQLRNEKQIVELGIIGTESIANRFVPESKYVSGVIVKGVYDTNENSAMEFCQKHELDFYSSDFEEFISKVSAVYIACPNISHYDYVKKCLECGRHVLCEKPMVLSKNQAIELYNLSKEQNLVLIEALETAYSQGFVHLISLVKSGVIGEIRDVDVSFTLQNSENMQVSDSNGSMIELASYTLLPILKIFGINFKNIKFFPLIKNGIDVFTRGILEYDNGIGSFKVGLGVKSESDLIISGTKGYVYVPSPWNHTEYFELRFENSNFNKKYFYKFDGDGLRYELNEFVRNITLKTNHSNDYLFKKRESIAIIEIIEKFLNSIKK